jgi:hypothetical protein
MSEFRLLSDVLKTKRYKTTQVVRDVRKAIADGSLTFVFESDMGFKGQGASITTSLTGKGVIKDFYILPNSNFDIWWDDREKTHIVPPKRQKNVFRLKTIDEILSLSVEELKTYQDEQQTYQTGIIKRIKTNK